MFLRRIFKNIKGFYFQVYYRWYLLEPNDKNQAAKLGAIICWGGIFFNVFTFFSLLVYFGIVEYEGSDQFGSFYIVSAILASIIYFPNDRKLEKHLYANLDLLKKQDKAFQRKWRIIAYLYPVVSFVLLSLLANYFDNKVQ